MLRRCRVKRWYSSKVSKTSAGRPRLVMNTGQLAAARWASVADRRNPRLDSVVIQPTPGNFSRKYGP